MAIPETISVGLSPRVGAHQKAQAVATFLVNLDVPVLNWTVGNLGEVSMLVRQGGGAERVYQFSGAPPELVTRQLILERFELLEAHVDG